MARDCPEGIRQYGSQEFRCTQEHYYGSRSNLGQVTMQSGKQKSTKRLLLCQRGIADRPNLRVAAQGPVVRIARCRVPKNLRVKLRCKGTDGMKKHEDKDGSKKRVDEFSTVRPLYLRHSCGNSQTSSSRRATALRSQK